jgi:extradiol dioxygenase family protein
METLFHFAFPVSDLAEARRFYGGVLGCPEGRSSSAWVDFNLYGHQIVAHLRPEHSRAPLSNSVDGKEVPIPHFGAILEMNEWQALAERVRSAGIKFLIEPHVRFRGERGEQATMFFLDPSGNALEFKAFGDRSLIFAQ